LLPVFKHSSQPRALGVTLLMVPRCEQSLFMIVTPSSLLFRRLSRLFHYRRDLLGAQQQSYVASRELDYILYAGFRRRRQSHDQRGNHDRQGFHLQPQWVAKSSVLFSHKDLARRIARWYW
jgi:hypothetical protein